MRQFLFLVALLAATCAANSAEAAISMLTAYTQAYARNVDASTAVDGTLTGGAVAAIATGARSTTTTSFGLSELLTTMEHDRGSGGLSKASSNSVAQFEATAALDYLIEGSYSNSFGYSLFSVTLEDTTMMMTLMKFSTAHRNNQSTLGGSYSTSISSPTGDSVVVSGSPSGTLTLGHTYRLTVEVYTSSSETDDLPNMDGGALGSGSVRLSTTPSQVSGPIPGSTTVPEPASMAAWGLGLIASALYASRRRSP